MGSPTAAASAAGSQVSFKRTRRAGSHAAPVGKDAGTARTVSGIAADDKRLVLTDCPNISNSDRPRARTWAVTVTGLISVVPLFWGNKAKRRSITS